MSLLHRALDQLNAIDAASLPALVQAELLRSLERAEAKHTVARSRVLGAFAGQAAYHDDGQGSARAWLRWQARVTGGAAGGAVGWVRRLAAHPVIGAALAAGELSVSWARQVCAWTGQLPLAQQADADEILVGAARGGVDLAGLGGLAREMWERSRPGGAPADDGFAERGFHLGVTFGGAGRAEGNLTPHCAAALDAVLESLGKKAGPEDHRTAAQRRHDALQEACRRLIGAGMLPGRAAQPPHVQLHMTLSQLRGAPGASGTEAAWAAARASQPGWLSGPAAGAAACDASIAPLVTGTIDYLALDQMTALYLALHGLDGTPGISPATATPGPATMPGPAEPGRAHVDGQVHPGGQEAAWGGAGAPGQGDGPGHAGPAGQAHPLDQGTPAGWAGPSDHDAPSAPGPCDAPGQADASGQVHPSSQGTAAGAASAPGQGDVPGYGQLAGQAKPAGPGPAGPAAPGQAGPGQAAPGQAGPGQAGPGGRALAACSCCGREHAARRPLLSPEAMFRLRMTLLRLAADVMSGPAGLAATLRAAQHAGTPEGGSSQPLTIPIPLDTGHATPVIPASLRRAVTTRHTHCAFPGCRTPATACDLHHLIPRSQGGATTLGNLAPMCEFHHLIVIHKWGWTLRLNPDGTTTATSPNGQRTLHDTGPPQAA